MNKEIKLKINNLLSLLDEKLKEQDIVEITESENKSIYEYLEKEGFLNICYSVNYKQNSPIMTEKNASLNLWYKDINKNWIINVYQIFQIV